MNDNSVLAVLAVCFFTFSGLMITNLSGVDIEKEKTKQAELQWKQVELQWKIDSVTSLRGLPLD
jgi:hypothetical protein